MHHSNPGTGCKEESEIPHLASHTGLRNVVLMVWQLTLGQIGVCGVGTLSQGTRARSGRLSFLGEAPGMAHLTTAQCRGRHHQEGGGSRNGYR